MNQVHLFSMWYVFLSMNNEIIYGQRFIKAWSSAKVELYCSDWEGMYV